MIFLPITATQCASVFVAELQCVRGVLQKCTPTARELFPQGYGCKQGSCMALSPILSNNFSLVNAPTADRFTPTLDDLVHCLFVLD